MASVIASTSTQTLHSLSVIAGLQSKHSTGPANAVCAVRPQLRSSFLSSSRSSLPVGKISLRPSFSRRHARCQALSEDHHASSSGKDSAVLISSKPGFVVPATPETKSADIWQHPVVSFASALAQRCGLMLLGGVSVLQRPVIVAALVASIVLSAPGASLAAKGGGRIGGSSFSSGRSGSYGGGGAPSRSYSAPSYSVSPSFSAPYFAPSPFGGYAPFGAPVYGPSVVVASSGGFDFFNFLLLAATFFGFVMVARSFLGAGDDEGLLGASTRTSVVRLQVGLLGLARTLQRDLERIADRADTSTPEGLQYILTETVLALLRHPDYCVYASSTSDVKESVESAEVRFNEISFEERSKFEEETLVNVGSLRKRVSRAPQAERFTSEYIVVTIVVAAEGKLELPSVTSTADLRSALSKMGSLTADQIQAVEILWTPQNEEDTLSQQEVLRDYPALRNL
eukprot:jgi/Mesen1/3157/ME000184S02224